jgi:hypothetical protein
MLWEFFRKVMKLSCFLVQLVTILSLYVISV